MTDNKEKITLTDWLFILFIVLAIFGCGIIVEKIFFAPEPETTVVTRIVITDIKQTCEELGGKYSSSVFNTNKDGYGIWSIKDEFCTKNNVKYEWSSENSQYESEEVKVLK